MTAIVLLLADSYGLPINSPSAIGIGGLTLVIASIISEVVSKRPRFFYIPLWIIGMVALTYGIFNVLGPIFLLVLLPIVWVVNHILKSTEQDKIHHATLITHHYTETDTNDLRSEIEENLHRREEAINRNKPHHP